MSYRDIVKNSSNDETIAAKQVGDPSSAQWEEGQDLLCKEDGVSAWHLQQGQLEDVWLNPAKA